MSNSKLKLRFALPAIAAIAFGCAHQPASVAPPTEQSAVQAHAGQASAPSAGTHDYTVLARGGRGGGNVKRGGGGWTGNRGNRNQAGNAKKGGGGGWTGNRGNRNDHRGGNRDRQRSGNWKGGSWTGTHSYGRHGNHRWDRNSGWWGHRNYGTSGWWGNGYWWTYGGTPWWGYGAQPAWWGTASLVSSQLVYVDGFYYPFYNYGGTVYPDYSRPFIFNGVTYVPYSSTTLPIPNQGLGIPTTNAEVVNAPAATIAD
jgi:hypothetical protein